MSPFPLEPSHTNIASNIIILCPVAAALYLLESVSSERLISTSVDLSPTRKFKTLMLLSIGRCSISLDSQKTLLFEFPPRCHKMGSWSLEFSNWKKISSLICTKLIHHITWCVHGQKIFIAYSRRGNIMGYLFYYIPVR